MKVLVAARFLALSSSVFAVVQQGAKVAYLGRLKGGYLGEIPKILMIL